MTDGRSSIAGKYWPGGSPVITCLLDEGALTPATGAIDRFGQEQTIYTAAAPLREGDWVALSNDTANTYAATGGVPVVEKAVNGETLVVGFIKSMGDKASFPATAAAADTLAERLAAGMLRTASVVMVAFNAVVKATVMCDGTNACVPGVGATLAFNITGAYADHVLSFDSASANGVGVVPLHYVAAGTDGDEYTILAGITGMMIAATGA